MTKKMHVKISYLPERPDQMMIRHMAVERICQEIRRAINAWLYREE